MAKSSEYAYYIQGENLCLVERDYQSNTGLTSPSSVPAVDIPISHAKWTSPLATVFQGLRIRYTYAPVFRKIYSHKNTGLTHMQRIEATGYLAVSDLVAPYTNYNTDFDVGDYIWLDNIRDYTGIHKISAIEDYLGGTNNQIITETISSTLKEGFSTSPITINSGDVNNCTVMKVLMMEDESFELDLHNSVANALVYYVKARFAEDIGELELSEILMRKFRKQIEKYESAKVPGPRRIMPVTGSII